MKKTTVILLAAASSVAAQGVIDNGLLWRNLSDFNGWPLVAIENSINHGALPGWQIATPSQVYSLMLDLNICSEAPCRDNTASPFYKAETSLGTTYNNAGYGGFLAMASDSTAWGAEPVVINGTPTFVPALGNAWYNPNVAFTGISTWLVQEVPEPASGGLLVLGLVLAYRKGCR